MAYKTKQNIVQSRDEYSRYYPGFTGVDFNSDAADVAVTRMAFAQNVYKDWHSEQGGAIETIPGYRELAAFGGGNANGIHHWQDSAGTHRVAVHVGDKLNVFNHADRDSLATANAEVFEGLADHRSVSFLHHNVLYILDGTHYYRLDEDGLTEVKERAYEPISYSDGEAYEQRNMLTNKFINRYNLVNLSDYAVDIKGVFVFDYDEENKTAALKGFVDDADAIDMKVVTTPRKTVHNGEVYDVTAIADDAFSGNTNISKVVVRDNIKTIGAHAFENCDNLTVLDIAGHNWQTDTITEGNLESIGRYAFANCPRLSCIYLTSSKTLTVGDYAFQGKTKTTHKTVVLGRNVKGETVNPTTTDAGKAEILARSPFWGAENESIYVVLCFEGDNNLSTNDTLYYFAERVATGTVSQGFRYYTNINIERVMWDGSKSDVVVELYSPINKYLYTTDPEVKLENGGDHYNIVVRGVGNLIVGLTDGTTYMLHVCDWVNPFDEQEYEYRFTVYDPCVLVNAVEVNGMDITGVPEYAWSVAKKDSYVSQVIITVKSPNLLQDAELKIHGTGEEGKFTTVEKYVNAIDGNSDYKGTALEAISGCTICAAYDGRIFLSGNPHLPNTVFYSQRDLTGYNNPEFFGVLNFINDGVSNTPVVAMMATSSALCVLKGDTVQEGSIYYHTGADTGDNIVPRIYPSAQGLAGLGCLGACCNFYDDPVFISRRGLEAVGKEQVNLERTLEHRSFNVDVKLTAERLRNARMTEWLGYLVILCEGRIYLADSRQVFTHKTGVANYEWYYVSPVGCWNNPHTRFFTLTEDNTVIVRQSVYKLSELQVYRSGTYRSFSFDTESRYIDNGTDYGSYYETDAYYNKKAIGKTVRYIVTDDGRHIPIDTVGELIGGQFIPATEVLCVEDVLYFLAGDKLHCFNTDKRGKSVDVNGEEVDVDPDAIHKSWYTFCGHRYESGFSTKSDNCDIPHLNKQTRRNSFVLRVKAMGGSQIKARGKAERGQFAEWVDLKVTSNDFDISAVSFDNLSMIGRDTHMCILREMFRKWYEKQIYFYSDGYQAPFGIYSAAFRYSVQGRIRV